MSGFSSKPPLVTTCFVSPIAFEDANPSRLYFCFRSINIPYLYKSANKIMKDFFLLKCATLKGDEGNNIGAGGYCYSSSGITDDRKVSD